ncbi:AcrR family transcriptional regulator [Streptomyces sp. B3I7]|uniref:TetR/AcrR family transcriptional regulator n=1 Tax=Streptomyces sp. B3I7 TaxID=3042269 RepID=UPI00278A3791|nr:TetR/AcrR family transcriptional regulator [Streptomyces sp. B3I7]MDQ0815105.1 AcrR family transcriptional regulator [Streptomyces sp. B3I7]
MTSDRRRFHPRKQPRQARAELTRQRILTAAAHVFGELGYAAGTTNRIAERARVSIGSLYQYYPNKDAILLELVTRHLDDGREALRRLRDEALPGTLEGIFRAHVRIVIENHRHDPHLLQVMTEQTPRSSEVFERVSRYERERVAYVEELLTRHPDARVDDTYVAARLIVATVELLVHQLTAAPDPIEATRLETELVAMVTRYATAGGAV